MTAPESPDGLRGVMRRAADSALDATVGRVGASVSEAALEVTNATAQQVIEDLEPYLVSEAIPRILAGITPYLTEEVVPEVLDGLTDHLSTVTVPEVVDGVTGHLVEVTVPEVVAGVTPRLVDDLLPRILSDLRPYLERELVPQIVDSLMPKIEQEIAPKLLDGLLPAIRDEVAPQLVDALMPKIKAEVAPQVVDALMPKIRAEVVPVILDDIVDDPRIRDLIREQSQGLFLDAIESFRGKLADIDSLVERIGRRLVGKRPRPAPETALGLVLADTSKAGTAPVHFALDDLSARRAQWRALPVPPAPPGRDFTYAGAVTRLLGLTLDIFVVGYLGTVLFSNLTSLLDSLFGGNPPQWLAAILVVLAASVIPVYLGLCSWTFGRSMGMAVVGIRVSTPDGRRPGFFRAFVRSWAEVFGLFFWLLTAAVSLFDRKRRSLLDLLVQTEVRYSVPETQQRRHVRDAVLSQQRSARMAS